MLMILEGRVEDEASIQLRVLKVNQEVLLWEPKAKYVEQASPVYFHTSMKVPSLESFFETPFEHGAGSLTWRVGFLVADVPESFQNFRAQLRKSGQGLVGCPVWCHSFWPGPY